jgi:hypothetical protein
MSDLGGGRVPQVVERNRGGSSDRPQGLQAARS